MRQFLHLPGKVISFYPAIPLIFFDAAISAYSSGFGDMFISPETMHHQ